jgi:hypothetical protein
VGQVPVEVCDRGVGEAPDRQAPGGDARPMPLSERRERSRDLGQPGQIGLGVCPLAEGDHREGDEQDRSR